MKPKTHGDKQLVFQSHRVPLPFPSSNKAGATVTELVPLVPGSEFWY